MSRIDARFAAVWTIFYGDDQPVCVDFWKYMLALRL